MTAPSHRKNRSDAQLVEDRTEHRIERIEPLLGVLHLGETGERDLHRLRIGERARRAHRRCGIEQLVDHDVPDRIGTGESRAQGVALAIQASVLQHRLRAFHPRCDFCSSRGLPPHAHAGAPNACSDRT